MDLNPRSRAPEARSIDQGSPTFARSLAHDPYLGVAELITKSFVLGHRGLGFILSRRKVRYPSARIINSIRI